MCVKRSGRMQTEGAGAATTVSVGISGTASTETPMTTTVEVLVLDPQRGGDITLPATGSSNDCSVAAKQQSTNHSQTAFQSQACLRLLDTVQQLQSNNGQTINICNKGIDIFDAAENSGPYHGENMAKGRTINNSDTTCLTTNEITSSAGIEMGVEAARCIPFEHNQDNFPVLPLDVHDSAAIVLEQQEFNANQDVQEKSVNSEESQVILVYQDVLTCGLCSKQFLEMMDFLEHKLEHTLGNSFYRCELCKLFFMKQTILVSHYRKRHHIANFGDGLLIPVSRESGIDDDQPGLQGNVEEVLEGNSPIKSETGKDQVLFTRKGLIATAGELNSAEQEVCHPVLNKNEAYDMSEQCNASAGCGTEADNDSGISNLNAVLQDEHGAGSQNALHILDITPEKDGGDVNQSHSECSIRVSLVPDKPVMDKKEMAGQSTECETVPVEPQPDQLTELSDDPKSSDKGKSKDFNFILLTESIRGSSYGFGKTWFKCLHCEYKTQSKASITRHMHDRHEDMLDVHQMITVFEKQQNSQKKVMKMSAYEAMREPAIVRWGSKNKPKAKRRFDRQDLPGVYPCNDCGKVFHRLRYLRKHAMVHRTDRKFLCDECGKAFKSKNLLTQHRKIHDKVKLFRCNQCDFQSRVNAAIHAHRQIHSQGSVLCDICGYAYTDKSTLSKHKRVHDANRPFACNFPGCTWRFKTEVMCKAHIRAHTTEGKFKCSYCGYAFRHKHHLIRHESNMHGVKRSKTRTPNSSIVAEEVMDSEVIDTVNLVVDPSQLPDGISEHHLVVTTDSNGTPITCTYEAADMSALNVAYHTLMQAPETQGHDEKTILLTQPDTHIVFK